jgi:hypothetical protein
MSNWNSNELTRIGRPDEIEIAVKGPGGRLRNRVTVWAVPHGGALYVRSAVRGRDAAWFRAARDTRRGQIFAAGIERDIAFEDATHDSDAEIDDAYISKYRRYEGRILNSVLTPEARSTTLKVVPRAERS